MLKGAGGRSRRLRRCPSPAPRRRARRAAVDAGRRSFHGVCGSALRRAEVPALPGRFRPPVRRRRLTDRLRIDQVGAPAPTRGGIGPGRAAAAHDSCAGQRRADASSGLRERARGVDRFIRRQRTGTGARERRCGRARAARVPARAWPWAKPAHATTVPRWPSDDLGTYAGAGYTAGAFWRPASSASKAAAACWWAATKQCVKRSSWRRRPARAEAHGLSLRHPQPRQQLAPPLNVTSPPARWWRSQPCP